jgi:hypothetical protein
MIAVCYTMFSEWMNLSRQSWQYSEAMPVARAFGIEIGLSPLAQWLVTPLVALTLGRRAWLRCNSQKASL